MAETLPAWFQSWEQPIPVARSTDSLTSDVASATTSLSTSHDHSAEVAELAKDAIWSSIPPETYTPNININILRLLKNGVFEITIFKKNTKTHRFHVKIDSTEVASVRAKIQGMQNWEKITEEGWDNLNGPEEQDGNTFIAHRKVVLGNDGFELHWKVSHKKTWDQVQVNDQLLIARNGEILEERDEEAIVD